VHHIRSLRSALSFHGDRVGEPGLESIPCLQFEPQLAERRKGWGTTTGLMNVTLPRASVHARTSSTAVRLNGSGAR
jgi:hypothetical protein